MPCLGYGQLRPKLAANWLKSKMSTVPLRSKSLARPALLLPKSLAKRLKSKMSTRPLPSRSPVNAQPGGHRDAQARRGGGVQLIAAAKAEHRPAGIAQVQAGLQHGFHPREAVPALARTEPDRLLLTTPQAVMLKWAAKRRLPTITALADSFKDVLPEACEVEPIGFLDDRLGETGTGEPIDDEDR